jgi:hypothetical protein
LCPLATTLINSKKINLVCFIFPVLVVQILLINSN